MRRGLVLLLFSSACTAQVAPPTVTGAELCHRISTTLLEGATACCGSDGPSRGVRDFAAHCATELAPLVDDPVVGFDARPLDAILADASEQLARCDVSALDTSLRDFRMLLPGTIAPGASCASIIGSDAEILYACQGGFCSRSDVGLGPGVCAPYVVRGGACDADYQCQSGLYCRIATTESLGSCQIRGDVGAPCSTPYACSSSLCAAGTCAMPDVHPQALCEGPAPSAGRDVVLTMTGLAASPTREVTLRVLDATGTQVVIDTIRGVSAATLTDRMPRALPDGSTDLVVQVWTVDPMETVPEMRTWELPVDASSPFAVTIDATSPTTPRTRMPVPSLDTSFDLQTFDFDLEIGKPFHVRVVDDLTQHTVAQGRIDPIADLAFEITIPDCIVPGNQYQMLLYVDENADGIYQPPPVDHAWRLLAIAPASGGLSLPYAWSSEYQDVSF